MQGGMKPRLRRLIRHLPVRGYGWLRSLLALRCARRPRVAVGDGRTDAAGGGSGLRMGIARRAVSYRVIAGGAGTRYVIRGARINVGSD